MVLGMPFCQENLAFARFFARIWQFWALHSTLHLRTQSTPHSVAKQVWSFGFECRVKCEVKRVWSRMCSKWSNAGKKLGKFIVFSNFVIDYICSNFVVLEKILLVLPKFRISSWAFTKSYTKNQVSSIFGWFYQQNCVFRFEIHFGNTADSNLFYLHK